MEAASCAPELPDACQQSTSLDVERQFQDDHDVRYATGALQFAT
jgi:hypothetical protein